MIYIDKKSMIPKYLQIYEQIKKEILNGTMQQEQRIFSSRELAQVLGVSRNTVNSAYAQLEAEGYIYPKRGVGFCVIKVPQIANGISHKVQEKTKCIQKESFYKQKVKYELTNSSHTSDLFPKSIWKKCTLESIDRLEQEAKLTEFQDKQGELYLRQNLLKYLKRIRGVACDESQIVITCGFQQSLEYVCNILSDTGNKIMMEEPGYHKARVLFEHSGYLIGTVPVDRNGLCVDKLSYESNVSALYTTPSHQFPTGVTLTIDRRYELLSWAQKHGVYILEDDFDSEQRFYAKPVPSLQSIDRYGNVIYFGTFSKALSPSIRMGYMILPPALIEKYHKRYDEYNATVPVLNQYIIGRMLESGLYDKHIRRLNQVFKKRLEAFHIAFENISNHIQLVSNGTGQYFLLHFSQETSQEVLIAKALEQGVRVYSTMKFWQDQAECPPNTLFLGLSKINIEEIPDCVKRLQKAWDAWL